MFTFFINLPLITKYTNCHNSIFTQNDNGKLTGNFLQLTHFHICKSKGKTLFTFVRWRLFEIFEINLKRGGGGAVLCLILCMFRTLIEILVKKCVHLKKSRVICQKKPMFRFLIATDLLIDGLKSVLRRIGNNSAVKRRQQT